MKKRESLPRRYRIKDLLVDRDSGTIHRRGNRLNVNGLSFRVLDTLAQQAPQPVSHRELVAAVWGPLIVTEDTLRQRIRMLRQALGSSDYVLSERGLGYRLGYPARASLLWGENWRWMLLIGACALLLSIAVTGSFSGQEFRHELRHFIYH